MKAGALCWFLVSFAVAARSQGTVNFINLVPAQAVNAPVYESDGVTKCAGSQFMAELLAGPSIDSLASVATIGFLTGNEAGYFNAGTKTVNTVIGGGFAWVQVDVWNTASGPTFAQAKASGLPNSWWQSQTFTVRLGDPSVPTVPAALSGLGTSPVYLNAVPEPSALALLGCGMVVVFAKGLNPSKHRMSGTNVHLKTGSRGTPLIGGFDRSPKFAARVVA